jgi:predicted RNase H-like HicB family nuclease
LTKIGEIIRATEVDIVVTRTLTAVLHREEDMYVAECPEVGTVSQGFTVEEATANLKEATELYLEDFPLPRTEKPILTTFEVGVN